MRMPLPAMLLMIFAAIGADTYIYFDIRAYCRKEKKRFWPAAYLVTCAFCYGLLLAILVSPLRERTSSISAVMWMLYTYLSIYIPKFIYVIFSLFGRLLPAFRRKKVNYGAMLGFPLAIIVFMLMWWGVIFTRHEMEVIPVEIYSEKLPPSFNNYKIVQFSDAHVGTWGKDTTFISQLVEKINSLNPDLIVFTGDIVNRETGELEPFMKVLSRLKAKDGVYSILGNHDYGDYIDWEYSSERDTNNALLQVWQKQMGWNMLNNEHRFIRRGNDSIALIGVENWGEPPFHQYGNLGKAYNLSRDSIHNVNDSNFKILLSHNPEHWNREVSKISNIDLTLSGHTHAMQFMIRFGDWKWSPSKYRYSQWGGLYERLNQDGEPVKLYVNIGCGEVAIPTRIGAIPEITEIILKRGNAQNEK